MARSLGNGVAGSLVFFVLEVVDALPRYKRWGRVGKRIVANNLMMRTVLYSAQSAMDSHGHLGHHGWMSTSLGSECLS